MSRITSTAVSRRRILVSGGAGILALMGLTALPKAARATPETFRAALKSVVGNQVPKQEKVELKLPEIAENGNTVPLTVAVDSPMTAQNYVKEIHILADENPSPLVATFHMGPDTGKAEASIRIRLAKTQNVAAVAVMNDGSVYSKSVQVKVTIGGCGG